MNTKIPLFCLLFFMVLPAPATVVVYRKSQTSQYIGEGQNLRIPATGFVVLDADTLKGFDITVYNFRGNKFFTVEPFEEDTRYYSVSGAGGHDYTAFVSSAITNKTSQFEDRINFAIGVNVTLAVSPTNTVSLPRTVKFTGGGVAIPTGETGVAVQGTGVGAYSNTETKLANSHGETPADSLARYRALLLSRGYEEMSE